MVHRAAITGSTKVNPAIMINKVKISEIAEIPTPITPTVMVVTPEVNEQVQKWGINVEQVSFPDLGQIQTYRIISDSIKPINPFISNSQE